MIEGPCFYKHGAPNGALTPTPGRATSRLPLRQAPRVSSLWLAVCLALLAGVPSGATAAQETSTDRTTVILVVGAPGEAEFGSNFVHQASLWEQACTRAGCRRITLGLDPLPLGAPASSPASFNPLGASASPPALLGTPAPSAAHDQGKAPASSPQPSPAPTTPTNDFQRLKQTLEAEPKAGAGQLWLVLIGHGTFDGKEARFNLRGPDVSAGDLASWLKPFRRPLAVLNTASCSAPFLTQLSATNRVIITATRSGHEQYFTRFGQYLAEAITDPEADLDKDGQVSLLEAFLIASRRTSEFYKVAGRLATEHALLDDNGDGLGTPAEWFRGLRATKRPRENAPLDGLLAQQFCLVPSDTERTLSPAERSQRDALERAVILHREKKGELAEDDYYRQLEKLLLELAQFYSAHPADPVPSNPK